MKYTIPEGKRNDVEKLVTRLQKKAEKYGKAFSISYGEPYAAELPIYEVGLDPVTGAQSKYLDHTIKVEAFDIELDGDIIKQDGYSVVAQIEHLDGGNIVKPFGGEVKAAWVESDCRCEHCKTNRVRKLNYIVRHESGKEVQVGSTCLKDYCGINPQTIGYRNELESLLIENDIERLDVSSGGFARAFDTVKMLALAIRLVNTQGYIKSDSKGANKEKLADMAYANAEPTEAELAQAQEMAKVIDSMDTKEALSNLLSDTQTLIRTTYCKASYFGYIAYAPVAYSKYLEAQKRKAKWEAEHQAQMASEYVGEVGKRMTFEIAEFKLVTSWETQYGMTHLYKFTDTNGNVLVWFASGYLGEWDDDKQRYIVPENLTRIKATVKAHNERDGVKQTIINRVKVA